MHAKDSRSCCSFFSDACRSCCRYHTIKSLIDKRTRKKIVFIHGDVSDGSKNDAKMRYLIGPDWKKITGAEQPTVEKLVFSEKYGKEIPQSVGYDHDVYWKELIEREVQKLTSIL